MTDTNTNINTDINNTSTNNSSVNNNNNTISIVDTNTNELIILTCPHCEDSIIIEQLNCRIFRHGVLKLNNTQINPHAKKEECDHFINNDLIYGCGKPFQVIDKEDGKYEAIICEYI